MKNKTIGMSILVVGICINSAACKNAYNEDENHQKKMAPLYTTSLGTGSGRNCAETDNGFYWLKRNAMTGITHIMFYDNEKEESEILCNKPYCTHETDQCAAVLYGDWNSLASWNGKLYFVADKMKYQDDKWILEKSHVLWRADSTGEKREELYAIDLLNERLEESYDQTMGYNVDCYGFGDGYLVARILKETESKDSKELQNIDQLMAFKVNGKLNDAIVLSDYADSNSSEKTFLCAADGVIYLYDTNSKKIERYKRNEKLEDLKEEKWNVESLLGAAVIDNALYFYSDGTGVFRWSDNESEPICLIDDENWDTPGIIWSDNGIIVQQMFESDGFNGNCFRCYDLSGNAESDWISISGMVAVWDYLQEGVFLENRMDNTYYLAKLENGECKFQLLK